MSVFLLQDRYLKLCDGEEISLFPTNVKFRIKLAPLDAFGVKSDDQRSTFKIGETFDYVIHKDCGEVKWKGAFLEELNSEYAYKGIKFKIIGNILFMEYEAESMQSIVDNAFSLNTIIPALLSFRMQTFISIQSFFIEHSKGLYGCFVSRVAPPVTATTEEKNDEHIAKSLERWLDIPKGEEVFVIALHYYRHALQLSSIEPSPQTMIPEVILNLSKVLEILLHDANDTDKFEDKSQQIGLEKDFIEQKLKPILILRNKIGSGHAMSVPLSIEQKDMVQKFIMAAFHNVQFVIEHVWQQARAGKYTFKPLAQELDKKQQDLLNRIESYMSTPNKKPL